MNSLIIGQSRPKQILRRALEHQRVPHAYLFNGPDGVGKVAMALSFAQAMFCTAENERPCGECKNCRRIHTFQHPDVTFLFPSSAKSVDEERKVLDSIQENPYARLKPWANPSISIDKIRELRHISTLKPLEGKRMVIIADAERMTIPAANSLLKILEEPPPTTHLILTASRAGSMLPTILSRCQEIRFGPLSDADIEYKLIEKQGVEPERAQLISRAGQGSYSRALQWLHDDFSGKRNAAVEFVRVSLRDLRVRLDAIDSVLQTYNKKDIKDILGLMLIWYRDALVLVENQPTQQVVNKDELETLRKFVGAFESIQFDSIFENIETSIRMIDQNIQLNLILAVLLNKLRYSMKLEFRVSDQLIDK